MNAFVHSVQIRDRPGYVIIEKVKAQDVPTLQFQVLQ